MRFFTGWVISAGLAVTTMGAQAQTYPVDRTSGATRYIAVSDFGGPYEEAPMPRYGYGPMLLAPREVYAIVRENGFSPLGIPQPRGLFYSIAVIDRNGDDGRLVIDGRNGRIIRFMPAYEMGDNSIERGGAYDSMRALPPVGDVRGGPPRPPGSVPRLASRTPPMPKPSPLTAGPAPESHQQSAAVQVKPEPQPVPSMPPPVIEAKPSAPPIAPTQAMPSVQGFE